MTVAEARAALGTFTVPGARAKVGCGYATETSLPAGVKVMVENGIVVRVDVDSGNVATAEGARVGDTEERVRSLYGARVSVTPHKYTDGHYLTVKPAAASDTLHRIVFETHKGRVTTYRAGQRPQVEYVERCG